MPPSHLLALSHDELGVIFDGLVNPLEPFVAVAFSSTCEGLRAPLQVSLEVLKQQHKRAAVLCRNLGTSCEELREDEQLGWSFFNLTSTDLATLGMLLPKWLPMLHNINLEGCGIGDEGVHTLCAGLRGGSLPSLDALALDRNDLGPAGAEALAAALRRGAMPALAAIGLSGNGDIVAALAAPLRKLPALKRIDVQGCEIGDDGVAMLVDNLGKDDFKALEQLSLDECGLTDAGCAKLVSALDSGGMPSLRVVYGICSRVNPGASEAACWAVGDAVERARRFHHHARDRSRAALF